MIIFSDTSQLATLIESAAKAHHAAQKRLPHHEWAEWYAAYLESRTQLGDGPFGLKQLIESEGFADEYIRVRAAAGFYGPHAPEPEGFNESFDIYKPGDTAPTKENRS